MAGSDVLYSDPFTSRIDDLRFTLKAPIIGWYEAAKGTKYEAAAEVIMNAPPGRVFSSIIRRANLLWIAKTMEGGASPEAYFQMLFNIVSQGIRGDAELMPALAEFVLTLAIILGVFASISLFPLGPLAILALGMVGFLAWFMTPKDHYLALTPLDYIGIAAAGAIAVVGYILGHPLLYLPIGFIAYGIIVLPNVINDYRLAQSMGLRVLTSFNELLTKPVPTPLRKLSPIEERLIPLWLDAKNAGAPRFVSWANTLVGLYITTIGQVRRTLLMYSLLLLGMGVGITIFLPWYVFYQLVTTAGMEAIKTMVEYGGFLISGMPIQSYWTSIGVGVAGGYAFFDHRTGALFGGVLGVIAWVMLHAFFSIV